MSPGQFRTSFGLPSDASFCHNFCTSFKFGRRVYFARLRKMLKPPIARIYISEYVSGSRGPENCPIRVFLTELQLLTFTKVAPQLVLAGEAP